jgi:DNA polymerase-3 subunit gamma/tau
MAYQVLARKYRPQRFSDVAGQDHVTRTLLNALSQQRIAHGYIFSGHRGIGKTTIARILAMALNCRREIGSPERPTPEPCETCESCTEIKAGNAVDVIEIDAATNRGIDEIRELRDAARYRPARDRYKIYILDEAHQITDAAFNALLKTLEEPPDHVIFMMATTQPEDIPQTIRSRSQHFSFHAVSFEDILKELRGIAAKEHVDANETALALLAEAGDGSMRDALSIMDQAIASAPVENGKAVLDAAQIRELMGTVPNTVFERLLENISENQGAAVMEEANTLLNAGNSPSQIARQFVRYLRNCLMAKLGGENTALLEISADERARATRSAILFSEEDLTRFLQVMLRTFDELNYRQEPRFHLELGLMKLVHLQRLIPVEELLSQVGGRPAVAPARPATTPPSQPPVQRASTAGTPAPARQPLPSVPRNVPPPAPPAQPERPTFSPFEADRNRKRGVEEAHAQQASIQAESNAGLPKASLPQTTPEVPRNHEITRPVESRVAAAPVKVMEQETAVAVAEPEAEVAAPIGEGLAVLLPAAKDEEPGADDASEGLQNDTEPELSTAQAASNDGRLDQLRDAIVLALDEKGHQTASALMAAGGWRRDGDTVEVQVAVKKLMLGLVMNPEADKIAKAVMREMGLPPKLSVVPGEGGTGSSANRPVPQGSVQAQALENPLVKQAQELFRAEVRSILDLRDKR